MGKISHVAVIVTGAPLGSHSGPTIVDLRVDAHRLAHENDHRDASSEDQDETLEAVDASYALGFIHALFGGVFNPGAGAKKVFMKFARKALKHWFKHASAKDLMNIKIYDIVRRQ